LIRGIDFGYSVWGLTILNDELFVLSVVLPAVYVYDLKTLNRFAITLSLATIE